MASTRRKPCGRAQSQSEAGVEEAAPTDDNRRGKGGGRAKEYASSLPKPVCPKWKRSVFCTVPLVQYIYITPFTNDTAQCGTSSRSRKFKRHPIASKQRRSDARCPLVRPQKYMKIQSSLLIPSKRQHHFAPRSHCTPHALYTPPTPPALPFKETASLPSLHLTQTPSRPDTRVTPLPSEQYPSWPHPHSLCFT